MAKLQILSSKSILRALRKKGVRPAPRRGKGSHIALVGMDPEGRTRLVIVPKRKDIPVGTLQSILDLAGLSREEFLDLL